jgi:hypothetical protein
MKVIREYVRLREANMQLHTNHPLFRWRM